MVTLTPLDASFGAEIHGVRLAGDIADELMRTLVEALHAHRVIVIRDQSLDKDCFLRFGRLWGEPIPHVLDHMRMDGYRELMTVGNTQERDRDARIRNGAALWHTDQSYEEVPASATMLYSILAPREGGETRFCDMAGPMIPLTPPPGRESIPSRWRTSMDAVAALRAKSRSTRSSTTIRTAGCRRSITPW